jgi:DNA-binding transcriptional LysR family regulator
MLAKLRDHTEKLNIFLAVAQAGSFHGAAHVLRLSQPSLSHAIQVLEGVIGSQLFHRSRKGVQLTASGQELLKFSERLVVEIDGIEQRIRLGHEMAGTLNIGTYASFVTYLWPRFLRELSQKHKDLSTNLKTLRPPEIAGALLSRNCHIVVSTLSLSEKETTKVDLYKDVFGFFISSTLLKKISSKSLADLPIIYVPDAEGEGGTRLDQLLWQNGISFKKSYEMDTFEAVKSLALEGLGLAILPTRVAEMDHAKLKPVVGSGLYSKKFGEHRIYAHYLKSDEHDQRLKALVTELRRYVRDK